MKKNEIGGKRNTVKVGRKYCGGGGCKQDGQEKPHCKGGT